MKSLKQWCIGSPARTYSAMSSGNGSGESGAHLQGWRWEQPGRKSGRCLSLGHGFHRGCAIFRYLPRREGKYPESEWCSRCDGRKLYRNARPSGTSSVSPESLMFNPSSRWPTGTGFQRSSRVATRSPDRSYVLLAAAFAPSSSRNGWVWRVSLRILGTRGNFCLRSR